MSGPRSVLAEVGGFGMAVAAVSSAAAVAVIAALPAPSVPRMSVAAAAAALRGVPVAGVVTAAARPPTGERAALVEALLARRLGVPPAWVRATWVDPPPGAPPPVVIARGAAGPRVMLVRRDGATPRALAADALPAALAPAITAAPQPAFVAALRGADGRWRTVAPARDPLADWRLRALAALLACLAAIAPLSWLFARRLTRPFRRLLATPDAPDIGGPREVRAAAATIVAMRDRLALQARERTRMLAAMAHDLRTPLTGLRLRAETAPAVARDRMVADIVRMEAMIAEVLAYARDDADGRASRLEPLTVQPLLAAIIAEAQERGAPIDLDAAATDVAVRADAAALRRAVENLVQNAVEHAGGGSVTVTADTDTVTIAVVDRGPGIAPADRPRLLRPFERADTSRNRQTGGTGLGLSIVTEVAARHRGTFTLLPGPDGDGTAAILSLPRLSSPDRQAVAGSSAG